MYRFFRFPNGKYKAVTLSYDDGVRADIRFSEMLEKYGMKCTFNINSAWVSESGGDFKLSFDEIGEYLLGRGHEIAVHGEYHLAPAKQRTAAGIRDVLDCRVTLEKRFGRIIRGMAYPDSGITVQTTSAPSIDKIKEYLADLDIAYARTLGGDNDRFDIPNDWYAWMPTAHHNNSHIFDYIDKFVGMREEDRYFVYRTPLLFYLWGHSYEFDNDGNWDRIEEICQRLGGRDDVWYATNIEIHDYVKAYEALQWSADETLVYNPSRISVWFFCQNGRTYEVKSGEMLRIDY